MSQADHPDQPNPNRPDPEDQGSCGEPADGQDIPFGVGHQHVDLIKHGHRYVFRYTQGDEAALMASLLELAKDPASNLDMFDAAMLSHQIGKRMKCKFQEILKPL